MTAMTRLEHDSLGEFAVPSGAYYGSQTARAVENFPISGLRAPADLVTATVFIKKAAAQANVALGRLDRRAGEAIVSAADEILGGALRDQFVVDVYQAGAGTSHNMNVNEVLANRASELLGGARGEYRLVHPNDHVNMGQSTNDVFPTATRLALLLGRPSLLEAARALAASLQHKSSEFSSVLKVGRTHLQDAVPMTLGQEFGGYAACVARGADDVERMSTQLTEVNLGATAVGTGLNAGDDFSQRTVALLSASMGVDLAPAADRFRVTQSMGDVLAYSGAVRRLAVEGQPGVLSSRGVRHDRLRGRRSGTTRAQRHDARHRLERVARLDHPPQRDAGPARADGRGHYGRCSAQPGAARQKYGGRDGAQPVPRLREDSRNRQRFCGDRPHDS
jgi:aspartate ammonia-lyase